METESSSDLRIDVATPAKWTRRLTITVPAGRIAREREEVTRRLAKRLNLPGFRKGKVPSGVIEKRFGPAIEQELVERVVGEAYKEALTRQGLTPITQGEVEGLEYEAGTDLTFHVGFDVRPDVELERVGGFKVRRAQPAIGDDEVERVLQRLREEHAVWEPAESGNPTSGDMVAVEITALEEEGEAAQPRPYRFELGKGQAIQDVEDAIRTLAVGQDGEFILNVAGEGDATRQRRVRILLKELKHPRLPELDDEFARGVGEFDSLDDLRARVREDLVREADADAERALRQQIVDAIAAANPVELPPSMVEQYLDRALPAREGVDAERLAEAREMARPAAEAAIQRMLVIEKVAQMEGLHATRDELDARVEQLAGRWGRPVGEVWAQLQKSGRLAVLEEEITEDKVFEYLKAQSEIENA